MYRPHPFRTSDVELDKRLEEVLELLARNTHDKWSEAKMAQGYTYGPKVDDKEKKHPCLVDYDELPEEEKELDRITSRETIKALLALGYRIIPPEE